MNICNHLYKFIGPMLTIIASILIAVSVHFEYSENSTMEIFINKFCFKRINQCTVTDNCASIPFILLFVVCGCFIIANVENIIGSIKYKFRAATSSIISTLFFIA
ncbi:hypothetical protein MHBO_002858, partial [Bonamia ostreae]